MVISKIVNHIIELRFFCCTLQYGDLLFCALCLSHKLRERSLILARLRKINFYEVLKLLCVCSCSAKPGFYMIVTAVDLLRHIGDMSRISRRHVETITATIIWKPGFKLISALSMCPRNIPVWSVTSETSLRNLFHLMQLSLMCP